MQLNEDEMATIQEARGLLEQVKMSFINRTFKRHPGVSVKKLGEHKEADIDTLKSVTGVFVAIDNDLVKLVLPDLFVEGFDELQTEENNGNETD